MKIITPILLFFTSIFALPAWSIEPLMEQQLVVYYTIPFSGSSNHTHRFGLRVDTIAKQSNNALSYNRPTKSFALLDIPVNQSMFALRTYKDKYLTQSVAKTDPIEEQEQANNETIEETQTDEQASNGATEETQTDEQASNGATEETQTDEQASNGATEETQTDEQASNGATEETQTDEQASNGATEEIQANEQASNGATEEIQVDGTEGSEPSETALNISNKTAVGILLGVVIGAITIAAGSGG